MTKKIVFSDFDHHLDFAPLTLTRPTAKLRMGILTFEERWLKCIGEEVEVYYETEDYLAEKYKGISTAALHVDPLVTPTEAIVGKVMDLKPGQCLLDQNRKCIAFYEAEKAAASDEIKIEVERINHKWELFQKNKDLLEFDFERITKGRTSQPIPSSNKVLGTKVFLEEGATVEASILNSKTGPIYIGKEAEIMEGCMVRGGLAMGEHAVLKMGVKIYGPTTIGPYAKVGGEVNNSVFLGYSNKAHDGFMGNSIVGEWCNLGADSNTSNLKNNYSNVRLYDYHSKDLKSTTIQFCGVIMGDHAKTGINTMLNTATTVGVNANIFDAGFPPKYIPDFSWGGHEDAPAYQFNKAMEVAKVVMGRRNVALSDHDIAILQHLHPDE